MTGVLPGYLRRRVAFQVLGVLAAIVALLQLLGMMDAASDILDRGLGAGGIVFYAGMRLPFELMLALPLAALLGSLAAFQGLARTAEVTALRAAGVSLSRLMFWLLPVPLLLAGLQYYVADQVLPTAELRLSQWWQDSAPPDRDRDDGDLRWLHIDDDLFSFRAIDENATRIEGLSVYRRDADARLQSRLRAEAALWQDDGWLLQAVEAVHIDGDGLRIRHHDRLPWEVALRPADLLRLESPQPRLSRGDLVGVLAGGKASSQPLSFYEMALLRSFAQPFEAMVMMLLAAPALLAVGRGGQGGMRLLAGLGLGLAFLLVNGMAAALGSAGRLPALAAAALPPALFVVVGLTQLRRCDRL